MAVGLAAAATIEGRRQRDHPVNRVLLRRGRGHALVHGHQGAARPEGARRFIPAFRTTTLVAVVAFMLGGLVVSLAAELKQSSSPDAHAER